MNLAKVWPLEPGVKGVQPNDYSKVTLTPGKPGFMELEAALEAEKQDKVQLMAGKGFNELKEPRSAPTKKPEPKPEPKIEPVAEEKVETEYRTADMKPSEKHESEDKAEYRTTDIKPQTRRGRPPKNG